MKCIATLKQEVERMGGSLMDDNSTIYCDARPGYVWYANGCSVVCAPYANGSQTWALDACREALEDIKLGMRKCDAEESKQIEYDRGESWAADVDAPEQIAFWTDHD